MHLLFLRYAILVLIALPCFQNCIAKRKVDRAINLYYTKRNFSLQTESNSHLILNMDSIQPVNNYSQSHYQAYYTVPALVYYYTKELIKCDVNPKILVNYISNEIATTAESEESGKLFDEKEIELIFEKVPTSFYYYFKHHLVVPLMAPIPFLCYAHQSTQLFTRGDSISLRYIIRNNTTHLPIKQGKISYQVHLKTNEHEKGTKTEFLQEFYNYYDDDSLTSGKEIAAKIINELN